MLETFTNAEFEHPRHTKRVVVSGTWYQAYDDLESEFGHENILSPAVRLLSALISVFLVKSSQMKSFMYIFFKDVRQIELKQKLTQTSI